MARQYTVNGRVRLINGLVEFLNRFGFGGRDTYTLTTMGRKSGRPRATPVTLATVSGNRYLVSPYGEVGWVHNIRAGGTGTLSRRGSHYEVKVSDVTSDEAGPVLQQYVADLKIVRPYFDAPAGAGVDAFRAEADRHPVFRIEEWEPTTRPPAAS